MNKEAILTFLIYFPLFLFYILVILTLLGHITKLIILSIKVCQAKETILNTKTKIKSVASNVAYIFLMMVGLSFSRIAIENIWNLIF